jgi:hypothetical protein
LDVKSLGIVYILDWFGSRFQLKHPTETGVAGLAKVIVFAINDSGDAILVYDLPSVNVSLVPGCYA